VRNECQLSLLLQLAGSLFVVTVVLILSYTFWIPTAIQLLAQQPSPQNFVTYEKRSNFIQEFKVPVNERGLKGIITDSEQNVWFYHATINNSTILKMSKEGHNFTKYSIPGNTVADKAVINLAGGQLLFYNTSNAIWFTDARTNSLGKLDIKTSKIELFSLPTTNSGIMGLALSPDRKLVWFTERTGNKIGSLDIESKLITEYPTGDNSGPTLLTFDSNGVLWITLSYANSILRVEPWLLIPGSKSIGMYSIPLEKPDFFSPFGVATTQVNGVEKIFLSDHGSSRVIVSNSSSDLKNYTSYWTSPSRALPMALPSQVVSDKDGNIFFAEHGGNKIGKISTDNGIMIEFDIPTGPLATSLFLTVSEDGKRVWFTEWESNKIAYLDNSIQIPFTIAVRNNESTDTGPDMKPIILKQDDSHSVDVRLTLNNNVSSVALPNVTELSVAGMTDAGLKGIVYSSIPERVNLTAVPQADVKIDLTVESEEAVSGRYTIMIRASFLEKDGLTISLLYPQLIKLDVPNKPLVASKTENFQKFLSENPRSELSGLPFIGLIRTGAIAIVILLVGYLLYRKVGKRIKFKKE
jgi:virginiamycin B lyase